MTDSILATMVCEYCGVGIKPPKKRFCSQKCISSAWRKENPEKCRVSCRKHNELNRRKRAAQTAAYRAAHPGKAKESAREYRAKYPDISRKSVAKWQKEHPELVKAWNRSRRARKKGNGGELSKDIAEKLMNKQKGKCAICRARINKSRYDLDHIVPLSRGGKNEDKNVQLTCPWCNGSKGNKDPIQFMQERGYLL